MGEHKQDWLSAREATQRLGVKLQTLYAYASRGFVTSVPGPKGRGRLYSADDIARLKQRHDARSGNAPVAASALRWGEPAIETAVSEVRKDGPAYRGRPLSSLLDAQVGFEAACELLWTGSLPAETPRWPVLELSLPKAFSQLRMPEQPIAGWAALLGALGLVTPFDNAVSEELEIARARGLIVWLASSVRQVKPPARPNLSVSVRLLEAYGLVPRPRIVDVVDRALLLCADHELNASTFAARVTASAGANLCSSLSSAAHTLSGSLHGGMCARVEALLAEARALRNPADVVTARLSRGEAVPGFGHPLYPDGDPRGIELLLQSERISRPPPDYRRMRTICQSMRSAGQPAATLDAGLVTLTCALGLPTGSAAAIFALGRMGGWVAHILEQRRQGFIVRPRARYVGPASAGI